jgi:hypothetical protein
MVSIPFSSAHHSSWSCSYHWSVCNLVLANLIIVKLTKPSKKEKKDKKNTEPKKSIGGCGEQTNREQDKQTHEGKKILCSRTTEFHS